MISAEGDNQITVLGRLARSELRQPLEQCKLRESVIEPHIRRLGLAHWADLSPYRKSTEEHSLVDIPFVCTLLPYWSDGMSWRTS